MLNETIMLENETQIAANAKGRTAADAAPAGESPMKMDVEKYLTERVDDQIDYYGKTSRKNKNWYNRLRVMEILAASVIPFLTGYINENTLDLKIVAGVLGVVIAFISGIISLYKFQELWVEYRTTAESLKHQKYLFLTRAVPYENGEADFPLFVDNVENLISKENSKWTRNIVQAEKKGPGDQGASAADPSS